MERFLAYIPMSSFHCSLCWTCPVVAVQLCMLRKPNHTICWSNILIDWWNPIFLHQSNSLPHRSISMCSFLNSHFSRFSVGFSHISHIFSHFLSGKILHDVGPIWTPGAPRLERFPLNLKVAYIDHGGLGERRGPAGPAGPAGPGRPDVPWSGGGGGPNAGGLSLFNSVIVIIVINRK